MEVNCYCRKKTLDLDLANHVRYGIPLCYQRCVEQYEEDEARKYRAQREQATRITGSFEEGFHVRN